jgi:voltage-gated potassium channel
MRQSNFIYLFAGLLAMLAAEPLVEAVSPHSGIVQLTFTLALVFGVWSLHESRRWFPLGLALTGLAIVTSALYAYNRNEFVQVANLFIIATFCAVTIAIAFQQVVMRPGEVTVNRLMGGLCIYLLLGTLWAIFYAFVEYFVPNAFSYPSSAGRDILSEFLYFSFVTLTTLGYGDVAPVHPVARTLSYLEAVVGQLYIAVLIGTLVGQYRRARVSPDGA